MRAGGLGIGGSDGRFEPGLRFGEGGRTVRLL